MKTRPSSTKVPIPPPVHDCGTRAFTLMELMLALATSAVVLAGIGGVFFSAVRLRERTLAAVDESANLHHALGYLKRDLLGALPPGMLAGDFMSGPAGAMGGGLGYWMQFSSTSAIIDENAPWGDIQEIIYELRSPADRERRGNELVRTVSRNLLTVTQLDAEEQVLAEGIESFELACYDGVQWQDAWDTSLTETNLPLAVRVRIQLATSDDFDSLQREPLEMIIPLLSQLNSNEAADSTTEEEVPE